MSVSIGLQQLMSWCSRPDAKYLASILQKCSDADLIEGCNFDGPPGRLCWMELGRRRGFADFEIKASIVDGRLVVDATAPAPVVHHSPILRS